VQIAARNRTFSVVRRRLPALARRSRIWSIAIAAALWVKTSRLSLCNPLMRALSIAAATGADPTPRPRQPLNKHCELADPGAAFADVDHPDDRAVRLSGKRVCRSRRELVRAGIDVDGRLRRDSSERLSARPLFDWEGHGEPPESPALQDISDQWAAASSFRGPRIGAACAYSSCLNRLLVASGRSHGGQSSFPVFELLHG